MSSLQIEKLGRRYYLRGTPFSAKDQIKSAGCSWDSGQKSWWTGKADVAERLLAELATGVAASEQAQAALPAETGEMTTILGNTYPVRDRLRSLGGQWDAEAKVWRVPSSRAALARAAVESAPQSTRSASRRTFVRRGTWTGCSCGSVEEYERENDCASCAHDR